jgi:hypothetical protein
MTATTLARRSRVTAFRMPAPRPWRVLVALTLMACRPARDQPDTASQSASHSATQPANVFDPATARPGDTVAGLVLEEIRRERTPSGIWVGSARFSGERLLHGHTFAHPDGADYPFPCFEADSASARMLPRWAGDERRPWFCFENAEEARARIGPAAPERPLSIRVDRFTVNRNLTDAVNSARLLEVVADSSGAGAIARSLCFADTQSVLGRRPGTVAPRPPGVVGWIRLDADAGADSGRGALIDSDGRSLQAAWRRIASDSTRVEAFDDFVRVEMRLAIDDTSATGVAVASSDAAAQRDSTGRLTDFEVRWRVTARRAPCERLPVPRSG